jgi:hypothetical protein
MIMFKGKAELNNENGALVADFMALSWRTLMKHATSTEPQLLRLSSAHR